MTTPPENLPGADHEQTVSDAEGLTADVPAGGAGADTGAVSATEIDDADDARVPHVSSQNDIPGVGTRGGGSTSHPDPDESPEAAAPSTGEDHVDADSPIGRYQPGVGRSSAESSRVAQSLPDPDED